MIIQDSKNATSRIVSRILKNMRLFLRRRSGNIRCRFPMLKRTKREAVAWVNQFTMQQAHNLNMDFKAFWEIYRNDMKERLRENTMRSKDYIVELKILPYFRNRNISEISAADIREWQNTLLKKGYSQTYLRTVNNQLSCIFNYAVKYYDLPRNPMPSGRNYWKK